MTKLKLYEWAFKKFYHIVRKEKLEHQCVDLKCENCNEWLSISTILHSPPQFEDLYLKDLCYGYSMKCGQCGHVSKWNTVAFPFPARCDDNGNPIED